MMTKTRLFRVAMIIHPLMFSAVAMLSAAPSYAGSGAHGGGSFVCVVETKDNSGKVIREELLSAEQQDLWEAHGPESLKLATPEELLQLAKAEGFVTPDHVKEPEDELSYAVVHRIKAINTDLHARVSDALDFIIKLKKIEPFGIVYLKDSEHIFEKTDCPIGIPRFAQAAVYKDPEINEGSGELQPAELTYNKIIWHLFPLLDRAALNVHEAVYKALRDYDRDPNSKRTRKIVGYLFSRASKKTLTEILPPARFNPNSDFKYLEKLNQLKYRFENSGLPSKLPATGKKKRWEYRQCSVFSLARDVESLKVPSIHFPFKIDRDGNILKWGGAGSKFRIRENELVADVGGGQLKMREDANRDWILQLTGSKCNWGLFTDLLCNPAKHEQIPQVYYYCPSPAKPSSLTTDKQAQE